MTRAVASDALIALQDKLLDEMDRFAIHVAEGHCKDFSEYKHETGIILGLKMAENELLELDRKIEEA
jgi:hypothetical protein